jgi:hypothetical protein
LELIVKDSKGLESPIRQIAIFVESRDLAVRPGAPAGSEDAFADLLTEGMAVGTDEYGNAVLYEVGDDLSGNGSSDDHSGDKDDDDEEGCSDLDDLNSDGSGSGSSSGKGESIDGLPAAGDASPQVNVFFFMMSVFSAVLALIIFRRRNSLT